MTRHMQETKHYTKVISQEQLVSWKSGDGLLPSTSATSPTHATSAQNQNDNGGNHVSSVLTCKVCDASFSTLKDLSEHIVKSNHYKAGQAQGEGRPPHTSSSPPPVMSPSAAESSQTQSDVAAAASSVVVMTAQSYSQQKEKRKKSLPVRKLLELERAQQELSGQLKNAEDAAVAGKISCEKCGERIVMNLFVDHIRQCVGPLPISRQSIPATSPAQRTTPTTTSSEQPQKESSIATAGVDTSVGEEPKSILGSLEKMVQNNFGSKKKAETNLSILQRLGIDEGVDYSKPLIDPMAMFRPQTSAAAAAVAFSFLPRAAAAAAAAAQFASSEETNSKTRSSSECSSPDRYKAEVVPPANLTPVTVSKPRSPIVKSPSPTLNKNCKSKEDTRSDVGSAKGSETEKDIADNDSRSSSASLAVASNPSSPDQNVMTNSTNGEHADEPTEGEDRDDDAEDNKDKKSKKNHPLAALQMLCDKTETTKKGHSREKPESQNSEPTADAGSILAFSWACNQAVVNDSMLKCPFCDTPFISKGAYRHHLSKMHFVKDGSSPDPKMFGKVTTETSGNRKSPTPTGNGGDSTTGTEKEENAQSKFQKYSQLAKQLSCSGQP